MKSLWLVAAVVSCAAAVFAQNNRWPQARRRSGLSAGRAAVFGRGGGGKWRLVGARPAGLPPPARR